MYDVVPKNAATPIGKELRIEYRGRNCGTVTYTSL